MGKWAIFIKHLSSITDHSKCFATQVTHSTTHIRAPVAEAGTQGATPVFSTCRPQRPEIEPSILRSVDECSASWATAACNNLFFCHLSFSFLTFPSAASSALYFLSAAPSWHSDSHPAVAQTPDTGSAASGPSHTHTHTHGMKTADRDVPFYTRIIFNNTKTSYWDNGWRSKLKWSFKFVTQLKWHQNIILRPYKFFSW